MMALSSLTRRQALSGEWVFLGLRSRRACPNTAVCARAAPLLYPVPPSDSGHSRLVSGCSARFTPYDPFVALGPLWVFLVPVSLLPPPPLPFPCTTVRGPMPSLPTGAYFCGRPARLHPAGLPCPVIPDGLDASRTPFRFPPSPIHRHRVLVRSHPPFRAFCSGLVRG